MSGGGFQDEEVLRLYGCGPCAEIFQQDDAFLIYALTVGPGGCKFEEALDSDSWQRLGGDFKRNAIGEKSVLQYFVLFWKIWIFTNVMLPASGIFGTFLLAFSSFI